MGCVVGYYRHHELLRYSAVSAEGTTHTLAWPCPLWSWEPVIAEHRLPWAGGLGAKPSGVRHECWEATYVDKLIPGRTPILGLAVGEI